jgi:hypothetical protein
MKLACKWMLPMVALGFGVGLALTAGPGDAQQKTLLVAKKTTAAPALDGTWDAAWKAATPLTVKVIGGRGLQNGSTEVSLRAVYTADTAYFLM